MKYSIVFHMRSLRWMFRKDWYSTKRWGGEYPGGGRYWLIDFGSFTFGIRKVMKNDE